MENTEREKIIERINRNEHKEVYARVPKMDLMEEQYKALKTQMEYEIVDNYLFKTYEVDLIKRRKK